MEQGNSLLNESMKKTEDLFPIFEKKSPRMSMFVRAMVWNRKSHGLFDYESRDITKSQFSLKQSGLLRRENEKIEFCSHIDSVSEVEEDDEDPNVLSYIRQSSDSEYVLEPRDEFHPVDSS